MAAQHLVQHLSKHTDFATLEMETLLVACEDATAASALVTAINALNGGLGPLGLWTIETDSINKSHIHMKFRSRSSARSFHYMSQENPVYASKGEVAFDAVASGPHSRQAKSSSEEPGLSSSTGLFKDAGDDAGKPPTPGSEPPTKD